jgi:cation diffusion facilitator CzcD-associated flavoprotein CzcO
VTTNHGDAIQARYVAMANGYLQKPKLPGIEGITEFEGHAFHTSRWDYGYTGAGLENLADKRVGIIGTGATSIQCVPRLAPAVGELFVFQRTPSTVDVRANAPTDPAWAAALEPGWQQRRIENFQILTAGGQADEDLVADAWTSLAKAMPIAKAGTDPRASTAELADFAKMEEIRARIDALVTDPATAEGLKPWYGYYCKRPCFHDEYLQTFNRDNVTLVDLRKGPISAVTPAGIDTEQGFHELDVIIYATGFDAMTGALSRIDIRGRDGISLKDFWANEGPLCYLGIAVAGFPNLFIIQAPGSPAPASNFVAALEQHVDWISDCISHMRAHHYRTIEAQPEYQQDWIEHTTSLVAPTVLVHSSCNSWYNGGNVPGKKQMYMGYTGGIPEYRRRCDEVADAGYTGFKLA